MGQDIDWTFCSYSERLSLPKESGIYSFAIVCNNKIRIVYVGKSINVNTRISTHIPFLRQLISSLCDTELLLIGYYLSEEITMLEKSAIKHYSPIHNCGANKENRSEIGQQVIQALDGRPVRWLCMEIKVPEDEMSKKLNGKRQFTNEDIDKINKRLSCNILNIKLHRKNTTVKKD